MKETLPKKNNHHRCWQVAVLFVSALFTIAWGESWEEIRSSAGNIQSVSADFTQEKHMQILARPLISKGIFYYQAPTSLRWEYRTPVRNILMMHANGTRRFSQTENGMTEDAGANLMAMQIVLEQITQWLTGRFDENPLFDATLESGSKIVLTPKEEAFSKIIQQIELVLGRQPGVMEAVIIRESEDSHTRITFTNTILNKPIDTHLFREIK